MRSILNVKKVQEYSKKFILLNHFQTSFNTETSGLSILFQSCHIVYLKHIFRVLCFFNKDRWNVHSMNTKILKHSVSYSAFSNI